MPKNFKTEQVNQYAPQKVDASRILLTENLRNVLYAGIDTYNDSYESKINKFRKKNPNAPKATDDEIKNHTYFRKNLIFHLNTVIADENKKFAGAPSIRETSPEKANIKIKELLGKDAEQLSQLAFEEEQNSIAFRHALLDNSTTEQKDHPWIQRPIVIIGGPSGSGKSKAAVKALEEAKENIEKDLKSDPSTTQYVITCDGGIARETSQVYKAMTRAANILGYTGVEDIYKASKENISRTKNLIQQMALHPDSPHGVIIPNTFAKYGSLLPFQIQDSPIIKKVTELDPNNTKLVFCLVDGKDADLFRNMVAYLGSRRAWKTNWSANEDITTDLNDASNLTDSKAHNIDNFNYGVKGSAAAYNYLAEKLGNSFFGLKVINDLIFVKSDGKSWNKVEEYEAGAIAVSENNLNAWKADPHGKSLQDYNKANYNPTIILSSAFNLFAAHQALKHQIDSIESKNTIAVSELKKLKDTLADVDDILSGKSTKKVEDIQTNIDNLIASNKQGKLTKVLRTTSQRVNEYNSAAINARKEVAADKKDPNDSSSTPNIASTTAPTVTSSPDIDAEGKIKAKISNSILELQKNERNFTNQMQDFVLAIESSMTNLSAGEQNKLAGLIAPFKFMAQNPASQSLLMATNSEAIIDASNKMMSDTQLISKLKFFATEKAKGKSELDVFLTKLAWQNPSYFSNLLDTYNTIAAKHGRDKTMNFAVITSAPWQRIARYPMPINEAKAESDKAKPNTIDPKLKSKINDLSKSSSDLADNANKYLQAASNAIDTQITPPSNNDQQRQANFFILTAQIKRALTETRKSIFNLITGDPTDKQFIEILTRLLGAKEYINFISFDGKPENISNVINELNNVLAAINTNETSYTGSHAKEIKALINDMSEKLAKKLKKSSLVSDLETYSKLSESAIKQLAKNINEDTANAFGTLLINHLSPKKETYHLDSQAIELTQLGQKGGVFSADIPINADGDKTRLMVRLSDIMPTDPANARDRLKGKAKNFLTDEYYTKEYTDKTKKKYRIELSEYCTAGSLQDLINSGEATGNIEKAKAYFNNLQTMIASFNKHGVYFQDLKPSNLMLKNDGRLVVSDTKGLYVSANKNNKNAIVPAKGTQLSSLYLPDSLVNGTNDMLDMHAIQNYLLGITMYELITGIRPPKVNGKHVFDFNNKAFQTNEGKEIASEMIGMLQSGDPTLTLTTSQPAAHLNKPSTIAEIFNDAADSKAEKNSADKNRSNTKPASSYSISPEGLISLLKDYTDKEILSTPEVDARFAAIFIKIITNPTVLSEPTIKKTESIQLFRRLKTLFENSKALGESGIDIKKQEYKVFFDRVYPTEAADELAKDMPNKPATTKISLSATKPSARPPLLRRGSKIIFTQTNPTTVKLSSGTEVPLPPTSDTKISDHRDRAPVAHPKYHDVNEETSAPVSGQEKMMVPTSLVIKVLHASALKRFSLRADLIADINANQSSLKNKADNMLAEIIDPKNTTETALYQELSTIPDDEFAKLFDELPTMTDAPAVVNVDTEEINEILKNALGENAAVDDSQPNLTDEQKQKQDDFNARLNNLVDELMTEIDDSELENSLAQPNLTITDILEKTDALDQILAMGDPEVSAETEAPEASVDLDAEIDAWLREQSNSEIKDSSQPKPAGSPQLKPAIDELIKINDLLYQDALAISGLEPISRNFSNSFFIAKSKAIRDNIKSLKNLLKKDNLNLSSEKLPIIETCESLINLINKNHPPADGLTLYKALLTSNEALENIIMPLPAATTDANKPSTKKDDAKLANRNYDKTVAGLITMLSEKSSDEILTNSKLESVFATVFAQLIDREILQEDLAASIIKANPNNPAVIDSILHRIAYIAERSALLAEIGTSIKSEKFYAFFKNLSFENKRNDKELEATDETAKPAVTDLFDSDDSELREGLNENSISDREDDADKTIDDNIATPDIPDETIASLDTEPATLSPKIVGKPKNAKSSIQDEKAKNPEVAEAAEKPDRLKALITDVVNAAPSISTSKPAEALATQPTIENIEPKKNKTSSSSTILKVFNAFKNIFTSENAPKSKNPNQPKLEPITEDANEVKPFYAAPVSKPVEPQRPSPASEPVVSKPAAVSTTDTSGKPPLPTNVVEPFGPPPPTDIPKPPVITIAGTQPNPPAPTDVPPPAFAPPPPPDANEPAAGGPPKKMPPPVPSREGRPPLSTPNSEGGKAMVTPIVIPDLQHVFSGLFKTIAEVHASAKTVNTKLDAVIRDVDKQLKSVKRGPDGRPL